MQAEAEEQETSARLAYWAPSGSGAEETDQELAFQRSSRAPPLLVVPAAVQEEEVGQETPVREPPPSGSAALCRAALRYGRRSPE